MKNGTFSALRNRLGNGMRNGMRNGLPVWGLLVCGLAVALPAAASETEDLIREAVGKLAPTLEVSSISESPVPGMYEVLVGAHVVYVSADGRYLLQGSMFDMDSRVDLTERAKSVVRRDLLAEVGSDRRINFDAENPDFEVTIFTDIDCGYCRRLHQQMAEYNEAGISVSYLFFPRAGVGSKSFEKAVSVWCADDRNDALTDAKAGSDPEPQSCSNPIEEHFNLGRNLGVSGTPAMVAADGTLIPGYVPPEALLERLNAINSLGDNSSPAK